MGGLPTPVLIAKDLRAGIALGVESVPEVHGHQAVGAMATMTVMAGIAMLALGLAGPGRLVRLIPEAVLIGFVNAVAVNIVLSQLENLTGFTSTSGNRLTRAVDTLLHLGEVSWPSMLVGLVTALLILVLERTRLGALSMVVGIVVGSSLVLVLPGGTVRTIAGVAEVERSIPQLSLPDLSLVLALIVPALSLALVGLVQGAGISGSIPNPDGKYPNASADFRGQGIANIATGMLQGMPVGGSMSATALSRAAGARSASANLVAGIVMVLIVLLFAPLIGYITMPALAGLLMIIGARTFKPDQIVMVMKTGSVQIAVFLVTGDSTSRTIGDGGDRHPHALRQSVLRLR